MVIGLRTYFVVFGCFLFKGVKGFELIFASALLLDFFL